jgi:gas vesicle protein
VTERSQACMATLVGAVVGGVAGYLFLTEGGRRLRRQIEPALDNLANELSHFRGTVSKAGGLANEGWRLLNDTLGDAPAAARYPRQTNPF